MRIIGIFPKQIVVGLEFTAEDLELLKLALDHTTLNLDMTIPKHQQADEFIKKSLYPSVSQILKDLDDANA